MFKNYFKNEAQSEKIKKSNSSIISHTKMHSNFTPSVNQSKSKASTTAAYAVTTKIVQTRSSTSTVNTNDSLDKLTFKGAPARSAFTSTPLTVKAYDKKIFSDSKPFNVAVTTPYRCIQNHSVNNTPTSSTFAQDLRIKLDIKVKKSIKYYDDQNSIVPVYTTRSKRRGKLLLINNIKFANGKEIRKGAELDETNTHELFKQIGFEVVKYKNLSKKDLMAKVSAFRKDKTLAKVDIGAVIIMSHGTGKERSDSTEIACTDGERVPTTWIINEFDSTQCPQLDGKPKIFIFQCCRGEQYDIQHDAIPTTISRKLSDMLIAYATIPGFVAHRDPVHGTWYIQAICKVFMEHAHNTDVENLLKIVDSKLSSLVTDYGSKQTSSFENRGFKTCYLHP